MPECHSTNTLVMELSQRGSLADGTIVITDNQQAGRGQRGNQWISEPGKNLTFSVVLRPGFLKADQQFRLTQVISLAVTDYLKNRLYASIKIKWPNDIIVNELKICGILIENSLSGDTIQFTVAGIGLNINQTLFSVHNATSLKIETQQDFNLNTELSLVLQAIEARYLQLREGKILDEDYLNSLYRRGEWHLFQNSEGVIKGMIEGVDDRGRLIVSESEARRFYDLKEIRFI